MKRFWKNHETLDNLWYEGQAGEEKRTMKNFKTTQQSFRHEHYHSGRGRPEESGVALITVLALLSIFAVVLVGFTYSIRMEEFTLQAYQDTVNVSEASEAAIQGVLAQVARDLDPDEVHTVLGRQQPRYISLLDPWAVGYAGGVGDTVTYDARSHQLDIRSPRELRRTDFRFYPTPIPLGVDEDPEGDVTGSNSVNTQRISGDGFPGLKGVDDDLDGITDPRDAQGRLMSEDDDEDFLVNEDPLDRRRDGVFPAGTGYDADGDRLGVFDENSKININFAGNNFSSNGNFTYNQGVGPHELDLPVYLYGRVVQYRALTGNNTTFGAADAENLAKNIVSTRWGSIDGAAGPRFKPGENDQDDNNNDSPTIFDVVEFSDVASTQSFDGEPWAIVGNQRDDDGDGLLNEEDEIYIGPMTNTSSGAALDEPINNDDPENFRPGNFIDDDGDGFIDENDEGVDEPSEFDVFRPRGDDRPFGTVEDLQLVNGMKGEPAAPTGNPPHLPTLFEILSQSTTIYSQSDQISGVLSGRFNEVGKINPNTSTNWRAVDMWDAIRNTQRQADFQYSPPARIEDLSAMQADLDGDWQAQAEIDVQNGEADGIDNDGDGLIDEPSDDWDGNFFPSGDVDGFGESDVGAPGYRNGRDDDNDNFNDDEGRDRDRISGKLRLLPFDQNRQGFEGRFRDENDRELRSGLVVEGNGIDDDGDTIIDDTGDFNGDGKLSYDPEWHVSEDAWGDLSGDGFPGLGADIDQQDEDTAEGDIISRLETNKDLVITNFADDDWDGFADFYDPQVLAAMYAPELDGVDNDADGEVDEIGERYIAAFDDDEDGRMDEDPPQFQIALNLIDYIDNFAPYRVSEDPMVHDALGLSQNEPVLSDPVTFHTFELYNTRQRAFHMHPRLLAGANQNVQDRDIFDEFTRLTMPNPPHTGMTTTFQGVEAIRINEVFPKPVIRLQAEDVLEEVRYNPTNDPAQDGPQVQITEGNNFEVIEGDGDDGLEPSVQRYDSSWGAAQTPVTGSANQIPQTGHAFLPEGFRHTLNPFLPVANLDVLAPEFIFSVTNVRHQGSQVVQVGLEAETAEWTFENIPNGVYDFVLYIHPGHKYRPEVTYRFNGQPIDMISDAEGLTTQPSQGQTREQFQRNIAHFVSGDQLIPFPLNYRLVPANVPDQEDTLDSENRIEVTNEQLTIRITAPAPTTDDFYVTSFDRIELFNPNIQYVELVNLSNHDIDLTGWTVNTPYGHYVIDDDDDDPIIRRMKPGWETDDGQDLQSSQGRPGQGVPFENLFEDTSDAGSPLDSEELRLEDNKLLLAFNKQALQRYINNYFPRVEDLDERIVEPRLDSDQLNALLTTLQQNLDNERFTTGQLSDQNFRLVDFQQDVLVHNPERKLVTLYDPAGNYVDAFEYTTTFNNRIVDILGNEPVAAPQAGRPTLDLIAAPGYKGFESFERADPTHFRTEQVAVERGSTSGPNPPHWPLPPGSPAPAFELQGERKVPSNIRLDVKDAIIAEVILDDNSGELQRTRIGGYTSGNDPNDTGLTRFRDNFENSPFLTDQLFEGFRDAHWNGWDFIGDNFEYEEDLEVDPAARVSSWEARQAMSWEAVLNPRPDMRSDVFPGIIESRKTSFYNNLGGFENFRHVDMANPDQAEIATTNYTAFIWRLGVRELIRAGYDPDVDDQLTVRVLGRNAVGIVGRDSRFGMPVGEVLVNPSFNQLNPGSAALNQRSQTEENEDNIYVFSDDNGRLNNYREPVFAKLRHGDTAFTIDLRETFNSLSQDLRSQSGDEPMIEIAVIMRKTTPDLSPANFDFNERPDLLPIANVRQLSPIDGQYTINQTPNPFNMQNGFPLGSLMDDNYYFKGIELFGRGRQGSNDNEDANELRRMLAGTPGRDNTGYVPAYPRRRLETSGNQRDRLDIIDNTAFVKNAPLATLGEISRLFTGKKFETVNTPIIPQRLEDRGMDRARTFSNPELAQRVSGDNQSRIELAQRERLDQWENQYTQLYSMITTAGQGIVPGLVNINTAPREVLSALPSMPPPESPGSGLPRVQDRFLFNSVVADFILEGRQPGGHDMFFGIADLDDDEAASDYSRRKTAPDTLSDFKVTSVGRTRRSYKDFDDIESEVINTLNLQPRSVIDDVINWNDVFTSTIVSQPDDGPYSSIGELLAQITHLKRRERFSSALTRNQDRTFDGNVNGIGDLRQRLNENFDDELTPEDMEALMNRISNLITIRSRTFEIVTRGRVFDDEGNITAQRKIQTVYER